MADPTPRGYDSSPVMLGRARSDDDLFEPITDEEDALALAVQQVLYADGWDGADIEHVLGTVLAVRRARRP
jgi:hypothetical protein